MSRQVDDLRTNANPPAVSKRFGQNEVTEKIRANTWFKTNHLKRTAFDAGAGSPFVLVRVDRYTTHGRTEDIVSSAGTAK